MTVFLQLCCLGKCTGISFTCACARVILLPCVYATLKESTHIRLLKAWQPKVKPQWAGFSASNCILWLTILDFVITQANVDDRKTKDSTKMYLVKYLQTEDIYQRICLIDGIHLITKIRKNMKNSLMLLSDKIYLRKRALIETVNDQLKNICQIEHTRHRCFTNFIANMISALIAYNFLPLVLAPKCKQKTLLKFGNRWYTKCTQFENDCLGRTQVSLDTLSKPRSKPVVTI